jgi:hypothetical protein
MVSVAAGVVLLALAGLRSYLVDAKHPAESPSAAGASSAVTVPSSVVAPPPVIRQTATEPTPTTDEASLMTRVRAVQDADPELALVLARDGNTRFPDSADAPERAEIIVMALAHLGKPSEARQEAEAMVNKYPGTPWALEVERHTGAHPHRRP